PKTGAVGLTPFVFAGIMTLAGAGMMKKRMK
ncbi:LPXTG cell wall anchor domain-containing protein, partial [Acidaminobacter hydrogenoformans]